MIPRTKRQKEVARLSKTLAVLTEKQEQWIKQKTFPHIAYLCKEQVWCSDCAEVFEYKGGESVVCPKCAQKLKVQKSRKKFVNHEKAYVALYATRKDYQVARYFLVDRAARKGKGTWISINEAVQIWINKNDGKRTIMARAVKFMSRYYDGWNFNSEIEIRRDVYSYYGSRYSIWTDYILPNARFLPILKRNGLKQTLNKFVDIVSLFPLLLKDNNDIEMIIKTRQYDILKFMIKMNLEKVPFPHAINICNRNSYKVKDFSMYFDYLELLTFFGKDTHNAFYVCPANLKEEHDRFVNKKRLYDALEKEKENRRIAIQNEQIYKEQKGKYFGVCFGNDKIIISVLTSVDEFIKEGDAMHHCVFANRYYLKENSLILSAKDNEGNRIETIELDLSTFRVLQSRGRYNSNTQYHEEIISLVNKNISVIKGIA